MFFRERGASESESTSGSTSMLLDNVSIPSFLSFLYILNVFKTVYQQYIRYCKNIIMITGISRNCTDFRDKKLIVHLKQTMPMADNKCRIYLDFLLFLFGEGGGGVIGVFN